MAISTRNATSIQMFQDPAAIRHEPRVTPSEKMKLGLRPNLRHPRASVSGVPRISHRITSHRIAPVSQRAVEQWCHAGCEREERQRQSHLGRAGLELLLDRHGGEEVHGAHQRHQRQRQRREQQQLATAAPRTHTRAPSVPGDRYGRSRQPMHPSVAMAVTYDGTHRS